MLQSETRPKLLKAVENELITKKAEQVLEKDTGCKYMFQNKILEDLKLLYDCFKRDESCLKLIIKIMCPYIEERGEAIVQDETNLKDPIMYTQKLLDFKQEMDNMIDLSFLNDKNF